MPHFETYFLHELQFESSPNSVHKGFISSQIFGKIIFILSVICLIQLPFLNSLVWLFLNS